MLTTRIKNFNLFFNNFYFFIPLLFVLFLFSFPLVFFSEHYLNFYLSILGLYFFSILLETARISNSFIDSFLILIILIAGNMAPGIGTFFGFFTFLKNKV